MTTTRLIPPARAILWEYLARYPLLDLAIVAGLAVMVAAPSAPAAGRSWRSVAAAAADEGKPWVIFPVIVFFFEIVALFSVNTSRPRATPMRTPGLPDVPLPDVDRAVGRAGRCSSGRSRWPWAGSRWQCSCCPEFGMRYRWGRGAPCRGGGRAGVPPGDFVVAVRHEPGDGARGKHHPDGPDHARALADLPLGMGARLRVGRAADLSRRGLCRGGAKTSRLSTAGAMAAAAGGWADGRSRGSPRSSPPRSRGSRPPRGEAHALARVAEQGGGDVHDRRRPSR